ncbi:MAG: APC family permease [Pseudomonadales bacterium]|nr:amino acid permease [Pseudomonadales bacterium]
MSDNRLQRKIGLGGAVFTLIGYIVGASIFILPGQLAGLAGPAVVLAYLLASIPALVSCLIAAQVGAMLPVSAADYVFSSVVLHPFLGFLKVWTSTIALLVGVPLLAYGFADYFAFFLPEVDRIVVAVTVVVALMVINLLGLRTSVRTQMFMVAVFVTALLTFGIGGLFYVDWSLLTPVVPNGIDSVLSAAVPAFYSYSGFAVIVVIGEEIRNPGRTVPLTLVITFVIVATIYTLVTIVLPGLVPWEQLGTMVAPMSAASRLFLPEWFATFITLSALLAAATSINALILTTSRSFFALARNRIYPAALTHLSRSTREPNRAIVLVVAVTLIGIALQGEIIQYASVSTIGAMFYGIVWSIALIRMPVKLPDHYRDAAFRLSLPVIWIVAGIQISVSALFLYIGVRNNPEPSFVYLILVLIGATYYFARQQHLARRGVSLHDLLRHESRQTAT